jgi:hypothetical protein
MAFIAPALSVVSGVAGLVGGMQAGAQAQAAGAYQAAIATNYARVADENARRADADAKLAYRNANEAGLAGQIEAQDQDLSAAEQIAQVETDMSVSGLAGRSPTRYLASLSRLAGRDRSRIAAEGQARSAEFRAQAGAFEQEAADLRTGAITSRTDAGMARVNAAAEASASRIGGFSALVQGFGGATDVLLDGTRRAQARNDFNNIFRRRGGGGTNWWTRGRTNFAGLR